MLEHADRDDPIEASLRGAVILKGEGDPVGETAIRDTLPRPGQLLVRE